MGFPVRSMQKICLKLRFEEQQMSKWEVWIYEVFVQILFDNFYASEQ